MLRPRLSGQVWDIQLSPLLLSPFGWVDCFEEHFILIGLLAHHHEDGNGERRRITNLDRVVRGIP